MSKQFRMAVAATNANGEPDLYFCKVECSTAAHIQGVAYEIARIAAAQHGYSGDMVVFDEYDPPKALFTLCEWEKAAAYGPELLQ